MPVTAIVCADWSKDPARRDAYAALLPERRIERLPPPAERWTLASLMEAAGRVARDGSALVGIDVPLGVPTSLVDAVGLSKAARTFLDWLRIAGEDPALFETCPEPAHWSPRRPFFSVDAGPDGLRRWLRAMEARGVSAYRAIDAATLAKSPFVVSGIPGSVGSAVRDVWQAFLRMGEERAFKVWPFEGALEPLTRAGGLALGEIYPRASYAISLTPGPAAVRSRLSLAKTDPDCRAAALDLMLRLDWVRQHGVTVDGLDAARESDDAFDALVTAAALLRCALETTPLDSPRSHPFEGGILGTAGLNLELRERTLRLPGPRAGAAVTARSGSASPPRTPAAPPGRPGRGWRGP